MMVITFTSETDSLSTYEDFIHQKELNNYLLTHIATLVRNV